MKTTGGFSSESLLNQEVELTLGRFDPEIAIEIGRIASSFATERSLPVVIEVRIKDRVIYRACHEGSNPESDSWLTRKNRVVELTQHSTMYERVRAEELEFNWHADRQVSEELFAIHGGGFPIFSKALGFAGVLLISGLPQVEDHNLAVEVMKTFTKR